MRLNSKNWLTSLPQPSGTLSEVQLRGREFLFSNDLPPKNNESWRLADYEKLNRFLDLPVSNDSFLDSESRNLWPEVASGAFRVVLGPAGECNSEVSLPVGFRRLTNPEIEQMLGKTLDSCSCKDSWSVSLNHALTSELLAFSVSGRNLPPMELISHAKTNELCPTRVLIVLEENAELELLQVVLGSDFSAHSHLVEIHIGQEANLTHGLIGIGNNNSGFMANLAIEQELRSNYLFTSFIQGMAFGRVEPRLVQRDGQANTTIRGLQIAKGSEQLATHSSICFKGPNGTLDQLQKAIANDSSHSIFNGTIDVPRVAQGTNAEQLSRNLLLSSRARIDAKPELKIVADDVRCAHGATVSQLQQEEVFYLRSRGITSNQAAKLLLDGYCQEILEKLPSNAKNWIISDECKLII